MDSVSRLGWAASSTFRVGDLHLGVRSNSAAVDDLLRKALSPYLAPDVEAPANFSVWIELADASRASTKVTKLNRLYRSSTMVGRSRSPRRVVEALVSQMSTHGDNHDGLLLSVDAALVGDNQAIIVPNALRSAFEIVQPRLQRRGWRFVDSFVTAIDPDSGELVVRPPLLSIDQTPLGDLGDTGGREVPAVAPGRYPIARWVFVARPATDQPMSRATGLALAMNSVVKEALGPAPALRALAKVFERTVPCSVTFADEKAAADEILEVAADVGAEGL